VKAGIQAVRQLLLCAFAASCTSLAAAPAFQRPLMQLYDAPGLGKACDTALANARRTQKLMEQKKASTGVFNEWNQLQIGIEDVLNPVYLLGEVSPDKSVRDAAEPCLTKFVALSTELFQDEKIYRRVLAARPANAHQAKLRKDLLEGFEDNGATLPVQKRARVKAIFDQLEELRQAFDRNVRDDPTRVAFTPAEMEGMPESYLKAHEGKRDKDGNYVLTLAYPSYFPFLANARSGEARRRYYVAKLREGGEKNLKVLAGIFALRKELASLYGLPTFADYALRRRMVGNAATVDKFLASVKDAVTGLEKRELEELRGEKAKDLGAPLEQTRLERWDTSYYQERLRRSRFSVDQEALRKYFPTQKAIDYVLLVSQRLYGVTFREAKVPVWNPDVRYFDVLDAGSGAYLSGFYLDLYPREGKYNHAAQFGLRGASLVAKRTPSAALVANLNDKGLNHDELETLMHEFGHVMHAVLARTDYQPHSGNARQDFIEAPSKMYEEWARREGPLALMREVCAECPQLTHDEIGRLQAARRYGQGIRYARQWLYAAFDMELSKDPRPPLAVWKELEAATPQGHVEGTMLPASFSHIASNYAAGYYGYMWAEVLALDMLSAFKGDLMDPAVGRRYRDAILSQGSQEEEMDEVRKFLGREPSSDAFFAEITGKR
jgi:thimet oligopeptidase